MLLSLLFVQSCRKDVLVPNSKGIHSGLTIRDAKNYFNEHVKSNISSKKIMSTGGTGNHITNEQLLENILAEKQPIWQSAYQSLISTGAAVKIPLDLGKVFVITDEAKKEIIPFGALNYLFMYKDSLDRIHTEWITLIPAKDWLYGNRSQYSGDIEVKTWDGKFIKQLHYDRSTSNPGGHSTSSKASSIKKTSSDGQAPDIPSVNYVCISFANGSKCTCINKSNCDMCWQCTSNVCRTSPAGAIIPEVNGPEFWGGGGSGGGQSGPSGSVGGGPVYIDYVPPGCVSDPSYQIPNYSAPGGYEWAAPCSGPGGGIPIPTGPTVSSPYEYITNTMRITDVAEQNFLLANPAVYDVLRDFLNENVNSIENLKYVKWVVTYLLANPGLSIDELEYDDLDVPLMSELATYENISIDLSETKLPIDPRLITKYPKLMAVVKGLYSRVSSNPKIMTALKKYTGLTETAILNQLKVNKVGPVLVVRPNAQMRVIRRGKVVEPYGMFKGNDANQLFIYLNQDYVMYLENSTTDNYAQLEVLLSTIILHEYVHWADYNFNLFPSLGNVEYGELFEKDAFGGKIEYNKKNGKIYYNKY